MQDPGSLAESDAGAEDGRTLSIGMENFGPITRGMISLKPLTVFVGSNGCGKSHAASLLYIMAKLERAGGDCLGRHPGMPRGDMDARIRDEAAKIHEQHVRGSNTVYTDILRDVVEPKAEIEGAIREGLPAEPEAAIQLGRSRALLDVRSQVYGNARIRIAPEGVIVDGAGAPRVRIEFQDAGTGGALPGGNAEEERTADISIPSGCSAFDVYDALTSRLARHMSQKGHAYYFPAERAGLALARQAIAADALYRGERYLLSNTATDYLAFLALLPEDEGAFGAMSRVAEREIMRGEIVATATPERLPAIHYLKNGHKFPLHLAASSVKDLAPFFLYLKRVAKVNDLVILEEPEINLHPTSQILLARFIVRLVNRGLYVVATTHSPYFLEQISHCVKAGHMDGDGVDDVLPSAERLRPDKVAPYRFLRRNGGYEIQNMSVSADGIPQDEFMDVDGALYDELSRLRRLEPE